MVWGNIQTRVLRFHCGNFSSDRLDSCIAWRKATYGVGAADEHPIEQEWVEVNPKVG